MQVRPPLASLSPALLAFLQERHVALNTSCLCCSALLSFVLKLLIASRQSWGRPLHLISGTSGFLVCAASFHAHDQHYYLHVPQYVLPVPHLCSTNRSAAQVSLLSVT